MKILIGVLVGVAIAYYGFKYYRHLGRKIVYKNTHDQISYLCRHILLHRLPPSEMVLTSDTGPEWKITITVPEESNAKTVVDISLSGVSLRESIDSLNWTIAAPLIPPDSSQITLHGEFASQSDAIKPLSNLIDALLADGNEPGSRIFTGDTKGEPNYSQIFGDGKRVFRGQDPYAE